jgi:DUF917 family protein
VEDPVVDLKTQLTTHEDIEDFINGLAFYATGGGGPMTDGMELFTRELDEGRPIGWVDVDELPDDAWTVTATRMGGPPPVEGGPSAEELALYGLKEPDTHGNEGAGGQPRVNRQAVAVEALAKYAQVEISAIVPVELGGGNLPGAMATASRLGMSSIDGDYTGRAAPELGNMKVELSGRRVAPFALVDRWNNVTIVTKVSGAAMADRMSRMLGVASFGRLGMAAYLMPVREAKDTIVRNSMTRSLELGRVIRKGAAAGRPIEEVLEHTQGWLLFKGRVTKTERDPKGAFQHFYGEHHLEGTEEFAGSRFRIWFKNEHHVAWLDDKPLVTSPDLITVVDRKTGVPVLNVAIREGQDLAVIGLKPLDAIYRTKEAIDAFGPRHFGFDIDYVPIEDSLGAPGLSAVSGAAGTKRP